MTVSAPYTMKNGVKHVDRLMEVLIPHRTEGSSSAQQPAALSMGSQSRGLSPERTL